LPENVILKIPADAITMSLQISALHAFIRGSVIISGDPVSIIMGNILKIGPGKKETPTSLKKQTIHTMRSLEIFDNVPMLSAAMTIST
jgi:hypothetical protein